MLPLAMAGLASGGLSALGGLAGLFGHKRKNNPANAAMGYLNQIPEALRPYFQPYIDQGQQAGKKLTDQYDQMTQNTGDFYNNLGKGYKESPGYQFKLNQALNAGANASARGGMLGTPQDEQYSQQTAHDISNQDYEEYMKHIMDLFGMGQSGQQKMQEQGYDASTRYGENLGTNLSQKAQYAFGGQQMKNQQRSNALSQLFSGLSSGASSYFSAPMIQQLFDSYIKGGR